MSNEEIVKNLISKLQLSLNVMARDRKVVKTTENVTEICEGVSEDTFTDMISSLSVKGIALTSEITADPVRKYLVHATISR